MDEELYRIELDELRQEFRDFKSRTDSIGSLTQAQATNQAVMQKVLTMFEHTLFGNGSPGVLKELKEADDKTNKELKNLGDQTGSRITHLERWFWMAVGGIAVLQFLSGGGTISLKGLIGH